MKEPQNRMSVSLAEIEEGDINENVTKVEEILSHLIHLKHNDETATLRVDKSPEEEATDVILSEKVLALLTLLDALEDLDKKLELHLQQDLDRQDKP